MMNDELFDAQLNLFSKKVLANALTEEEKNNYTETIFESIRHTNEYGQEYWYARELQKILEYTEFNKFIPVINKAITSCEQSGELTSDHFAEASEMVQIGSGAKREFNSFKLSRYACYLIVMNGDSRKEVIALGQTYFAVKTRQQELVEHYDELNENEKRIAIRHEMTKHNKLLVAAAKDAGVETTRDYAIFQNHGYMGLYGGEKAQDIKKRKGLKSNEQILDHMGYEELAANLFRATQAEAKLKREQIQGKQNANKAHYTVGKEVRDTIERLGGTMPENLPTPDKSIKQLEKEQRKSID